MGLFLSNRKIVLPSEFGIKLPGVIDTKTFHICFLQHSCHIRNNFSNLLTLNSAIKFSIKERIWNVMAESIENIVVQGGNTQIKLAKRFNTESWY